MSDSKSGKISEGKVGSVKESEEDAATSSSSDSTPETVGDFYNRIDQKVQDFALEFLNFLPKSDAVEANIQIIADRLLTVKESAKLLVNNYIVEKNKIKTDKETKDD